MVSKQDRQSNTCI